MPGKVEKTPAGRGARTGSGAGAGQEARTQALRTRQFALRRDTDGRPSTFDREARSVEVVATTESPVPVYDWEEGTIGEVLLMSGLKLPQGRQVPLQDTHDRWSVQSTLGSARNLRVDGDALIATVVFSSVAEAEDAMTKVEEGHITDFSVGWRQHKAVRIPKGESRIIAGREFKGPLKVVTSWSVKELSIVPIGADERAKARSESGAEYQDMEGNTMNEKLRKALEALGLKKDASDDEAWTFFELHGGDRSMGEDEALNFCKGKASTAGTGTAGGGTEDQAGAGAGSQARAGAQDSEAVRAAEEAAKRAAEEATRNVLKRASDIRKLCAHYGCSELADSLIDAGKSIDEARAAILDHITGARRTDGLGVPAGRIEFGADARDKYRSAVVYALVKRADIKVKDFKEAPGHEDFRSYSLREIARHCLLTAGQPTGGDVMEMVGRALTTSDLPAIMADVANKALLSGFEFHEETYEIWTSTLPASDFKALNLVSISSLDDLEPLGEHGEYRYGSMLDKGEQAQLGTAGKIYPITRHALVNDELAAITMMFSGAGQKARKFEGDLVYGLLVANPVMQEDGLQLFGAAPPVGHGNVATVIGPPSAATLDEMDAILGARVDQNGQPLNIPLRYAIMPRGIFGAAESFFQTIQYVNATGDLLNNIWGGNRIERVYEPRLNLNPNTWYAAGPKGMTIVRTHLNGVQTPVIEQRDSWTIDGVELRVRYDVGAGVAEWRGMARNG